MKNIILGLIVVAALVAMGIGGAFASFVDTETSEGNVFETGSLDLLVNGEQDEDIGDGVGQVFSVTKARPGQWYTSGPILVENVGSDPEVAGDVVGVYEDVLFVHFKEMQCYNGTPNCCDRLTYEVPDASGPGDYPFKQEPEIVSEYGGKVDCTYVPGIGVQGDNCCMRGHTLVNVWYGTDDQVLENNEPIIVGEYMADLECKCKELGILPTSGENHYVWIQVMLPNMYETTYFDPVYEQGTPVWTCDDFYAEWPTNAFMEDGIMFDLEFLLVDEGYEDAERVEWTGGFND